MKLYPVKQYTPEEWDKVTEEAYDNGESPNDDEITIVWHGTHASMDIQATGKRIVPILRKVEQAMQAAGLAGQDGVFAGWFGAWADSLTDSSEKRYFIWQYDGKNDRDNGHWSYSWGIEQIDDDRWYIFLNIATVSNGIDNYLEGVIEEKKQAIKDIQATEAMESEDMENILGDIARIWFDRKDAESSDDFPVLWEIWRDGEQPKQRKINHANYQEAVSILNSCGYRF